MASGLDLCQERAARNRRSWRSMHKRRGMGRVCTRTLATSHSSSHINICRSTATFHLPACERQAECEAWRDVRKCGVVSVASDEVYVQSFHDCYSLHTSATCTNVIGNHGPITHNSTQLQSQVVRFMQNCSITQGDFHFSSLCELCE